ncbi:MAG: class I SAM-dependent DNA methyltransferase [Acidobacteriota bacterium]
MNTAPEADSVGEGYDRIAEAWQRARTGDSFKERALIERLVAPLPPKARILDLGCGGGEPIGRVLSTLGFDLTGVDVSARLLAYARRAVPGATFLQGDMRTLRVDGQFDAIVAWDSVFHLPREDHAPLFSRFRHWLRPKGRLLLSIGGSDEAGFTSEMWGVRFFYSGHQPAQARGLLAEAGFHIEHWEVDDPTSRGHVAIIALRDSG